MKTNFTLEKSIENTSQYDGNIYKSYVTSFFSDTKSHHTINDFYDEEGNVYIPKTICIYESKKDPDTNEIFVRAEVEFEDGLDMDFLLHKPLYFKEPEWFHDLTHKEIVQLDCIFEEYEPYGGPLTERKNVSINEDGTVQINKETYHVSKQIIHDLFNEIKINLGSEKTYKPFLSGGASSQYVLHLKNGCVIKYSGDYALCDGTPYGCKRYTKQIVDDFLKQVIDSFCEFE
ncbi:hypothetical protein [uncultured Holdemanella sp.]|uniref:hypothetical protein n=1 Tax=uncultured Holdemanella sp. TaxID=1763549 RepID=UPI0025FE65FF|nr:hypothetical protein [uncultured Holdemanella sp.]